ncbi:MAG: hypothetical protein JWM10_3460 [Myxococcaceae bacterium]|nr:hypothetical protein [Myxococcaceae bacterium]
MTNATRGSKETKKRAPKRAGSSLIVETKRAALEAQRKQLATMGRLIRRLATMVESFCDVGVALREVLEETLCVADGQASLGDCLAATKLVSLTQAGKLIAIVQRSLREEAMLVGQERAHAPVVLAGATPERDTAVVDTGLHAWLKLDALRPETTWLAGRATLTREQADALLACMG